MHRHLLPAFFGKGVKGAAPVRLIEAPQPEPVPRWEGLKAFQVLLTVPMHFPKNYFVLAVFS